MMLGPVVQRFAFGAYWTGWPFGTDLTDNKTALMWVTWIVACLMTRWNRAPQALRRGLVVIAALVMLAVYAVPHSVRGSQLDYSRLESVADPHDAIETGR
jgi:hypothetical protein